MKTFEEKWTAWVDDQLTGRELEQFEASLLDKAAAFSEKAGAKKLGIFLREQAPELSNADFFTHQLRERIAREDADEFVSEDEEVAAQGWWTIKRLLLGGLTSLAVFAFCATIIIRSEKPAADQSQYLSQILNARVDPTVSPDASISMFEKKDERVTVLWVEGLKSLPSEYAAK